MRRKLKPEEAKELKDHVVCVVGIAVVVNPNVKVDNLTSQQLIDIFTGKITNWKDVGGDDMKITLINRPSNSGTRATFKKYALKGADEAEGMALKEDQSGTVKQTVSQTEGAISYLAFSYLDEKTKPLKIDGIEPTSENVSNGTYPVWAYEHMYTKGEATGLTKSFIDYILSEEVQDNLVTKLKFIPIKDMKVKR
jgi:phosphate transport system substrate-binding protein